MGRLCRSPLKNLRQHGSLPRRNIRRRLPRFAVDRSRGRRNYHIRFGHLRAICRSGLRGSRSVVIPGLNRVYLRANGRR